MFNIIFEIGDWSGDGHSFSAQFLVKVNKNLEDLREIHFRENEFIGSLCREYNENYIYVSALYNFITEKTSHEKAIELLEKFKNEQDTEVLIENEDEVETMSVDENDCHTFHMYDAEAMLNIWLMILKVIDNSLEYEVISPSMSRYYIKYKGYPKKSDGEIHFYGHDKKDRHLKTPGYGIWTGDEDMEYNHSC